MLHQASLHIYPKSEEDNSYIGLIKKYAIRWMKLKDEGVNGVKYQYCYVYIDLYNLIRQYNISEDVIKNIYNEEQIKIALHKKYSNTQTPITRRDNKGVFIGGGYGGNCNMIRYPKKNRPLKVWKTFYEMFPREAELYHWNGKTSSKMK